MKNNFNTLRKYIYEYSEKEYQKKTINGLFRAILEPVIANQKFESCILFRLNDLQDKSATIQRLNFSGAQIYSYNNTLKEFNYIDEQKNKDIWGELEFVIIIGQRYSAALIWDYSEATSKDHSEVCLLYNSKIITEIAKKILENSNKDFSTLLQKYVPDRRENTILNKSINSLVNILNEKNEEIFFNEEEKKHLINSDETIKTAQIITDKAKFISHEIKNNLSIINLYSKILEKRLTGISVDSEIRESIEHAIKNITNSSENISSIISELRCISSPYLTEVNINNIIKNVISQCNEKAKKSKVKITSSNFDETTITTDKTKLECTLINIVFNAIEACEENCEIRINTIIEKEFIKIQVINNGSKIPEEIQSKIFEESFTTKGTGNGLGLAICKSQMKLINSDINLLYSNDDETVFEILLKINC